MALNRPQKWWAETRRRGVTLLNLSWDRAPTSGDSEFPTTLHTSAINHKSTKGTDDFGVMDKFLWVGKSIIQNSWIMRMGCIRKTGICQLQMGLRGSSRLPCLQWVTCFHKLPALNFRTGRALYRLVTLGTRGRRHAAVWGLGPMPPTPSSGLYNHPATDSLPHSAWHWMGDVIVPTVQQHGQWWWLMFALHSTVYKALSPVTSSWPLDEVGITSI